MKINEASIIPYNTNFNALRMNMQNGSCYPSMTGTTRCGDEDRLGSNTMFENDLILDIDVNITSMCEKYPKVSEEKVVENIKKYIDSLFTKYNSILKEKFFMLLHTTCVNAGTNFQINYGNATKEYVIINDSFIINPLYVYRLFEESPTKKYKGRITFEGNIYE